MLIQREKTCKRTRNCDVGKLSAFDAAKHRVIIFGSVMTNVISRVRVRTHRDVLHKTLKYIKLAAHFNVCGAINYRFLFLDP